MILGHAEKKNKQLTVKPGINVIPGQQAVDRDLVDDVEQEENHTG